MVVSLCKRLSLRITIGIIAVTFILLSVAGAATTIWDDSVSPLPFSWNYTNFDGFNVSGIGTESLTINETGLNSANRNISSRNDPEGAGLIYNTTRRLVEYEVSKNTGKSVERALDGAGMPITYGNYYARVNLFGEPYIALKGKANKLAKLVLEDNVKRALYVGSTWNMGDGYTLTVQSIDARASPRQAWLTLSKNGVKLDDKVVSQGEVYTYVEKSLAGETDVPLFVTNVGGIFAGRETDVVYLEYNWLVSRTATEIHAGDSNGVFITTTSMDTDLYFQNNEIITLAPDTARVLAGNLRLRVEDNSTTLKFYPTFDPASDPKLNITASKASVTVGTPENVIFTVIYKGSPVSGAVISLSWAAMGNVVTNSTGQAAIDINATNSGYVIATAGKTGYANGQTEIKVYPVPIASWNLEENYVLNLLDIDIKTYPRQVRLQLLKNRIVIEDSVVSEGSMFTYCPVNCTFNATLDMIFNGTQGSLIRFINASQKSEIDGKPLSINTTYLMKTANFSGISWALNESYDLKLMDIDAKAYPRQVWLELLKNNVVKDDVFLTIGQTYNYTNNSETIIKGKVDAIFSGTQGDLVKLINVSQFSEIGGAPLRNNATHLYESATFTGISWSLNGSYELKMKDIDDKASPRQVWLEFSKNNNILDDSVVSSQNYYNYSSGSVNLNAKVDGIFKGVYSGVVILKEVDLLENGTELLNDSNHSFISGMINRSDYALAEGYNLSLLGVDAKSSPRQAWLRLYKNSDQKDEKIVMQGDIYRYYNSSGSPVLYAKVDSIFAGATQDLVQFRNLTHYSELDGSILINNITTIWTNYPYSPAPTPTPGPTPTPTPVGNITSEIRGTIANETAIAGGFNLSAPPVTWTPKSFAGFYYDAGDKLGKEELSIKSINIPGRSIPAGSLYYNTTLEPKMLSVVTNAFGGNYTAAVGKGLEGFEGGSYRIVGWQGERYLTIKGKVNKLVKMVFEHGVDDKKTLAVGETWDIGDGWSITAQSIDAKASPRQAWMVLSKDGVKKDDKVISQGQVYTYSEKSLAGESDVPIFVTYVDSVFAGATSDMVQLKYTWAISTSVITIQPGQTFGILEVGSIAPNLILKNKNSVYLSRNSTVDITGSFKFKVADSNTLRFYPFVVAPLPSSINTTANDVTEIDARGKVNATLEFVTSNDTSGSINITMSNIIPSGMNNSFISTPLGKYLEIIAGDNIKNNLSWIKLKFYYTQAELDSSGLDETLLKISWYNESADRWETLNSGSPEWVHGTGVDTTDISGYAGHVWANISHLSTFALIGSTKTTDSTTTSNDNGGGGGGGGGGGTSGENFSNIEVRESHEEAIYKDKVTSYRFKNGSNPVLFINITGNISAGLVNTMVEVLRNTSTLVKNEAPGIIYKNSNIWVGSSGFAVPKNIKEAIIGFKVENSWLDNNKLAGGEVKMLRWSGSEWVQLETMMKEKDSTNTYFEAKTNYFSHFAIIGLKVEEGQALVPPETIEDKPGAIATSMQGKLKSTPGFNVIAVITALSLLYLLVKKKR